jgi:hypothetical protein
MPIAEPLCELGAAPVGVAVAAALSTRLDVGRADFVERMHHLLGRLFFDTWTVLDRKVM